MRAAGQGLTLPVLVANSMRRGMIAYGELRGGPTPFVFLLLGRHCERGINGSNQQSAVSNQQSANQHYTHPFGLIADC